MPVILEYVRVTVEQGPETREESLTVLIDGQEFGEIDELIEFEGGECVITLDPGGNYEPEEHRVTVEGTSLLTPTELVFRRK